MSGTVVGLDFSIMLSVADRLGYDDPEMVVLFAAMEEGLLRAEVLDGEGNPKGKGG